MAFDVTFEDLFQACQRCSTACSNGISAMRFLMSFSCAGAEVSIMLRLAIALVHFFVAGTEIPVWVRRYDVDADGPDGPVRK